jgi:hypothetical protein
MKRILWFTGLVVLMATALPAAAQMDSAVNLPNFLLPNFTRSIIKFKAGGENKTAMLNYNVVDEEMVFMQPDNYMVLNNPEVIDTIYMAGRKFIPVKKAFYEVLISGSSPLFMQYKTNTESLGTPTGYGATSKTQGNTYVRQVYGPVGSVDLKIPDDVKLTEDNYYWVTTDNSMEKFATKRQFLKIFKDKEKELNEFIDHNNISFKKVYDVVRLVLYYAKLKN